MRHGPCHLKVTMTQALARNGVARPLNRALPQRARRLCGILMASGLLAAGTAVAAVSTFGGSGSGAGQFLNPRALAVDPSGYVYVTDSDNHRVQKFDGAGNYVGQLGRQGLTDGQFNRPMAVAVDSGG